MKASKTDRIQLIRNNINSEIYALSERINLLDKRRSVINRIALNVFEPHALIPKWYKDVEEWMNGHPFPESIVNNVFSSKEYAFQYSLSCNTYQLDYHIVRCNPREYYIELYKKKGDK